MNHAKYFGLNIIADKSTAIPAKNNSGDCISNARGKRISTIFQYSQIKEWIHSLVLVYSIEDVVSTSYDSFSKPAESSQVDN